VKHILVKKVLLQDLLYITFIFRVFDYVIYQEDVVFCPSCYVLYVFFSLWKLLF